MRVGVIALLQESNTFLAAGTTLAHFERDVLCEGEEVRGRFDAAHHEVGGFLAGLDEEGIEVVPIFAARALPYGVIEAAAFDELLRRMLAALERAGPLDGLLVAPHGATVAENAPDADGHWLSLVRDRIGRGVPVIGTLDLHANLSPMMVAACDALIAYRTNPHLDQRRRGLDAAGLMARTLRGDVKPVMAAAFPPVVVNIERQATGESPCRELYALADEQIGRPGVLSNSVILGFPYADVPEVGAAVCVVTDDEPALARRLADQFAGHWWARRHDFVGRLIDVGTAIERAARAAGPVCLLDMGDNVGGGSPGDGTVLAHALHARHLTPAFVCLADAEAVAAAARAGTGNRVTLAVGGKTDDRHGPPLRAEFTVSGLFEGRFREAAATHGGIAAFDQGPTALLVTATGLTVMATTNRMAPFSLNQLTCCGLDPAWFRVLVAKGVHAPVAAYAAVCEELIRVDTPGVTSADFGRLTYRHRRRPLFPFEPGVVWTPGG